MSEQRLIERRAMGTATVVDGQIVMTPGGGDRARAPARRTPDNIARSREQLQVIDGILKRDKPRKGGLLHRLLMRSRADHKQVVDRVDYKRAVLRAASSRDERSAGDHLDMARELQAGLRSHYDGDVELTAVERRRIRAAVRWNLQQARY